MNLKQFFVDDAGELSCMRLLCMLTAVTILGLWVTANIVSLVQTGQNVALGAEEAKLLMAAIGGKVLQSRFENGPSGSAPGRESDD